MPAPCPQKTGPAALDAPKAPLTLAEVLRASLPLYRKNQVLLPPQGKVLRAILACRTPALGAHCFRCEGCGRDHVQLHSCRNRHCPSCQGSLAAAWLEKQQESLLPIPYFHLVFTLPHLLNPLVRQNRKVLYKLLFDSAAETLLEVGQRRFGGQIGLTAVLHTWSQNLGDHYHVHCIVTGGALGAQGWKSAPAHYLFSVRALSLVFRGKFCSALERLFGEKALECHGELEPLAQESNFRKLLRQAARPKWVVYAKKPFGGPMQVLEYLSLYTHRVALSQRRLVALDHAKQTVSFSYKDYADGARRKIMTLQLEEFARRFLLHLLPERFVKIRHYGILGNHGRAGRLEHIRALLERSPKPATKTRTGPPPPSTAAVLLATLLEPPGQSGQPRCPFCGSTQLKVLRIILPPSRPAPLDSS
jgi:hypothetical protein